MQLSYTALEICRQKLGIQCLRGFEQCPALGVEDITDETAVQALNELSRNGIIEYTDDSFRISLLGRAILDMMENPEQFFLLENALRKITTRIYLLDTHYLCVTEEARAEGSPSASPLNVQLLPGFDQVVGAFAYTLTAKDDAANQTDALHIVATAQDAHAVEIYGSFRDGKVDCRVTQNADEIQLDQGATVADLVNQLTGWMLKRVKETLDRKENEDVVHTR